MTIYKCGFCDSDLEIKSKADDCIVIWPCEKCMKEERESAYEDGHEEGHEAGYKEGHENGCDEGINK